MLKCVKQADMKMYPGFISPFQLQINLQIDLLVLLWWVSALGLRFVYYMTCLEELQALEIGMICCLFCVHVLRGVGNCTLTFWYSSPNNCCCNNHPPFISMAEWKLQCYRLLLILCMSLFRAIYHWRACCLLIVAFKKSVACGLYLMAYDAGCRLTRSSHHHMCILASARLSCFTSLPTMRGGGGEHCCFSKWWWVMALPQVLARDGVGLPSFRIVP